MQILRAREASVLILLMFMAASVAGADESDIKVTGMFSDMTYHDESGDVLGTEIFVVFSAQGYSVVFQSAEGEPTVPVVVHATIRKRKISFELPAQSGPLGRFEGEISADGLRGSFSGNGELMYLKRKSSYWQ